MCGKHQCLTLTLESGADMKTGWKNLKTNKAISKGWCPFLKLSISVNWKEWVSYLGVFHLLIKSKTCCWGAFKENEGLEEP